MIDEMLDGFRLEHVDTVAQFGRLAFGSLI